MIPAIRRTRRAEQLRASYIGYLDPVSLVPRSKLTLNRPQRQLLPELPGAAGAAAAAWPERLRTSPAPRRSPGSRRGSGAVGRWMGTAVASFVDGAVDKLFFTVITVTDELNAFQGLRNAERPRGTPVGNRPAEELPVLGRGPAAVLTNPKSLPWRAGGSPSSAWSAARACPSSCACTGTAATAWCARPICSRPCAA